MKHSKYATRLILLGCLALATAGTTFGATFVVDRTDDDAAATACADATPNDCSLRGAITAANALAGDDIITLPAGTYTLNNTVANNEDLNANGDLDFTSNITLNGAGSGTTFIEGNAAPNTAVERVVDIRGTVATVAVIINGVTIRNGSTNAGSLRGGGVRNVATLTVNNSIISSNRAISTTATAPIGGGIVNDLGVLTLNNVDVTGNTCSAAATTACTGAGVFIFGAANQTVNIINSRITNNIGTAGAAANASASGAGITMQSGGTFNITGSTISGNVGNGTGTGGSFGTGIRYIAQNTAGLANVLNVTNSTVSGNGNTTNGTNHNGAGVSISALPTGSTATFTGTLTNVTITGNTGTNQGAGAQIFNPVGTTTFNNSRITNNSLVSTTTSSPSGGGVLTFSGANVAFNNTTVSGNSVNSATAITFGAGLSLLGGTATFNNSSITGNTAASTFATGSSSGGGIYSENTPVTLNETTVSGNSANFGAGINSRSLNVATTFNINRSAIVNNTGTLSASGGGASGGLYHGAFGTFAADMNLNNSTVSGNTSPGSGGGVFNIANNTGNATVNVNFSTVASNTANSDNTGTQGGGGINNTTNAMAGITAVNLTSSVVADNVVGTGGTGPDIAGTITSLDYNHVENLTGGTFAPLANDVTGSDPALGALGLYGGNTQNHLPNAGSPLINTIPNGTNGCGTAPFNVDQKNVNRPFAGSCDKGASERGLVIITPSNGLPTAREGVQYSATLTADFGTPPYTFTLASGMLPPGLTVNMDGTITGTPGLGTSGTYTFSVQVSDATPFAPAAVQVKQFQIVVLAPGAASVTVGGRVLYGRRGIGNVVVTMTNQSGATRSARTNSLGYYRFDDVSAGTDYVFQATAKRYSFDPQVVTVTESTDDLNFAAQAAQK